MVAQLEAADLDNEEMALIIKRIKTTLKGHKNYNEKPKK
jgi:hypothetical protein